MLLGNFNQLMADFEHIILETNKGYYHVVKYDAYKPNQYILAIENKGTYYEEGKPPSADVPAEHLYTTEEILNKAASLEKYDGVRLLISAIFSRLIKHDDVELIRVDFPRFHAHVTCKAVRVD
jgi:hypothetical protein